MKVTIGNIGIINKAEIKIDGLTVIAGANDTGKSTIGKALFSTIVGFTRHEDIFKKEKEKKLSEQKNVIRINFREIDHFIHIFGRYEFMEKEHSRKNFRDFREEYRKIEYILHKIKVEDEISLEKKIKEIEVFLKKYEKEINEESIEDSKYNEKYRDKISYKDKYKDKYKERTTDSIKAIRKAIKEIKNIIGTKKDILEKYKRSLKRAYISEFKNDLINKSLNKNAFVELEEGEFNSKIILEKKGKEDKDFKIKDITTNDGLLHHKDITFIESPIILSMASIIKQANTFLEFEMEDSIKRLSFTSPVSLHFKDLIGKMVLGSIYGDEEDLEKWQLKLLEKVRKIMGGRWKYDENIEDFMFYPNEIKNKNISSWNMASGIKAFGMLELLIKGGKILEKDKPLIIDEPEVHAHPEWQIKYAEILIELVKNDIPVVVSSHSPYFIKALLVDARKEGLINKTNFYLAEKLKTKFGVKFKNVNDNLGIIFETLSKPMRYLMNSKEDI